MRVPSWLGRRQNPQPSSDAQDRGRQAVRGNQLDESPEGVVGGRGRGRGADRGGQPGPQDVVDAEEDSDHREEGRAQLSVRCRPTEAGEPSNDRIEHQSVKDVRSEEGHARSVQAQERHPGPGEGQEDGRVGELHARKTLCLPCATMTMPIGHVITRSVTPMHNQRRSSTPSWKAIE